MNYSRLNCNEPSSSKAKKNNQERSEWITNVIEGNRLAKEEREIREKVKIDNQRWIILLINMLGEEFKNESTLFFMLERDVFSHWGKYQDWKKNKQNTNSNNNGQIIYFRRTFSLAYTDIQRMNELWSKEMIERTLNVVKKAYKKYEETTGISIKVIDIIA